MADEKTDDQGPGEVWTVLRTTVRRFGALLAPTAAVVAPAILVMFLGLMVVVGKDGVIVNGELRSTGFGTLQVVWAFVSVLVLGSAALIAFAAGLLIAAGQLLDRPVGVRDAIRAAARRLPALVLAGLLASLPVLVIGVLTVRWLGTEPWLPFVVIVMVPVGWAVLPYVLLLIPATVLGGVNPFRAIPAARRAFVGRGFRTRLWLASLVAFAAGVSVLTDLVIEPLEVRWEIAPNTIGGPLMFLLVPLWVVGLAVLYLRQVYRPLFEKPAYGTEGADLDAAREILEPVGRGRPVAPDRARTIPVALLALVAPTVIAAGLIWVNPVGLPAITERTPVQVDREDELTFGWWSTRTSMVPTSTGSLWFTDHWQDDNEYDVTRCADPSCTGQATSWSSSDGDGRKVAGEHPPGVAALADGSVVMAAWGDGGSLRLSTCRDTTCKGDAEGEEGRVLVRDGGGEAYYAWAGVAPMPGGGLVVAHSARQENAPTRGVRLTFCADTTCRKPRTVALPTAFDEQDNRFRGALTVTSDGRPVVVASDSDDPLEVNVCDTRACKNPTVSRPAGDARVFGAMQLAIAADDRPIMVYEEADGFGYLACRTPACRSADTTALPSVAAVLAVDTEGRPLLATEWQSSPKEPVHALLVSCRDLSCREWDSVDLGAVRDGYRAKNLLVDRDGRPQILWKGARDDGAYGMNVTTCHRPLCGLRR